MLTLNRQFMKWWSFTDSLVSIQYCTFDIERGVLWVQTCSSFFPMNEGNEGKYGHDSFLSLLTGDVFMVPVRILRNLATSVIIYCYVWLDFPFPSDECGLQKKKVWFFFMQPQSRINNWAFAQVSHICMILVFSSKVCLNRYEGWKQAILELDRGKENCGNCTEPDSFILPNFFKINIQTKWINRSRAEMLTKQTGRLEWPVVSIYRVRFGARTEAHKLGARKFKK